MNDHQSNMRIRALGRRYPRQFAWVRVAVGIWLLVLTTVFYGSGRGGQWAWLLAAVAALHFCLAYRLFRFARTDSDRRMRLQ